ncbi:type II secretion system protein [Pseudomonas serbica]|uniref:type II secretion system protein n=1 Tax=Pseudomonas serbica TaxID=2965074 RepID=UPI00237C29FD|nr:prepilin-type N-terminal cleavage/methylation domain-containing protein [Pseudomonas serbica]
MKRNQRGFTLLELILAVSLTMFALMLNFSSKTGDLQIDQARQTGHVLLEYTNALRKWIAANPSQPVDQFGSNWLKPASCGGLSAIEYLPCSFPAATTAVPIPGGMVSIKTSITVAGIAPKEFTTATLQVSPYQVMTVGGAAARSDLSGVAALVVAAGNRLANQPQFSSTHLSVNSDPKTGAINIVARTNPSDDAWIRTDGKSSLHVPLVMSGPTLASRMITGVSRIQNLVGQPLVIGNSSAKTATLLPVVGAGVIVSADVEQMGRLYVQNGIRSNAGLTSAQTALQVNHGDISVKTGKAIGSQLIDADNAAYTLNPSASSRLNRLNVSGKITSATPVLFQGIKSDGTPCTANGAMGVNAKYEMVSCQEGKWKGISDPPKMYRFTYTSNGTWVVPQGVTGAQISMAGGGSSGLGWRSWSMQSGGHSGGYVYNHPVTLVPGETLTIEVGVGGKGVNPVTNPAWVAAPGLPYTYYNPPPGGEDGTVGFNGTSSKVVSATNGTLLECAGGSGAAMGGIDGYNGVGPGGVTMIITGSGKPKWPTASPAADGPYATYASAGTCGPAPANFIPGAGGGPVYYGQGNSGSQRYGQGFGTIQGGKSPFGYGSGGNTEVGQWYVTYDTVGLLIQTAAGRSGVVYIDVMY